MYQRHRIGVMMAPHTSVRLLTDEWPYWAADNGCFTGKWDADKWLAWLDTVPRHRCLFATAPDVVGDAAATYERRHWLDVIRGLGFAPAFVLQDGISDDLVPWDDFDWLFIGGTTEFKLSSTARRYMLEAKARGKQVHVGRVNSRKRLAWCARHGADSADGTYVGFGPDLNLPQVVGWLADVRSRMELEL